MQVRFDCPACKKSHVLDMPETTIHMTCSQTGKHLKLRLGLGGDVKAQIVSESGAEEEKEEEAPA
ncbi:MAG TPA: hypothetical protein VJZ71_10525 [Phycisphaerae bacterium]|nr:hypothetical protein [Phycisphaerae bacterium]